MIYWGRRKTDHWVEPTDCNKFVVWDALWPSPAPAIDTTSQLRHRCSGFVWARHALIEPSVEGHKAVERKRLPLSRSLEDHVPLSAETGSCEELPGFLSCIRPSRVRRSRRWAADPPCAMRSAANLRATETPSLPCPALYSSAWISKHATYQRPPRMRQRRSPPPFPRPSWALCPVAIGPHAPGQRVQLPLLVAFGPQPRRQHRVAHRGPGRSL